MKIIEVRDGFIKFEADKSISLSSFIKINGIEKNYIAQVIQLKRSGENAIGYAKILFLYDGGLLNYDKTLPPKESQISEFTSEILENAISVDKPVIAGKTVLNKHNVVIDESAFNKKMLISVDNSDANNILAKNFTRQFNNLSKNVIIIDTLGVIKAKKITAGVDFKLPLDTESLAFMYRDCLNDATEESKATIIEIFRELAEYSKTVPFVPFEALKTIVDDMVDKAHVFKLLVLKNKLAKFDRLGYFAKNREEVEKLKHFFNSKCTVIDLSHLDSAFQNRYLDFIYNTLKDFSNIQVFLEMSNVVSKKSIKNILSDENTPTAFITHSKFKYLNDIKNVFDNFIIVPSFANNEIFSIYSTFLRAMKADTYLLAGEATSYIPLVSSLENIEELPFIEPEEEENIQIEDELEQIAETTAEPVIESVVEEDSEPALTIEEENTQEEAPESSVIIENENTIDTLPPSEEEIYANIEEKSESIIAQAFEDLSTPEDINMFESDEENTEEVADSAIEEVITAEPLPESIEQTPEVLQEMLEEEQESPINEMEIEEIPLSDTFETEVHLNEEVNDYTPQDEIAEYKEITLNQEVEEGDLILTEHELSETEEIDEPKEEEEETSIELGDDIDLDLEEEPLEEITENNTSLQEDSPQEIEILPIAENENDNLDFDEIVELDPADTNENDIVIDMEEEPEEEIEDLDAQIVKDVDKVFTTRKEDDISDSDLDFIDELNNDEEVLLEEVSEDDAILEELSDPSEQDGIIDTSEEEPINLEEPASEPEILETRNSSTPIVPVYDADIPQEDLVMSDPIQQGDTVTHAKYGTGVVEKMIKYGNKTLFSINFDNIGRRLLDPTLTEIKKS